MRAAFDALVRHTRKVLSAQFSAGVTSDFLLKYSAATAAVIMIIGPFFGVTDANSTVGRARMLSDMRYHTRCGARALRIAQRPCRGMRSSETVPVHAWLRDRSVARQLVCQRFVHGWNSRTGWATAAEHSESLPIQCTHRLLLSAFRTCHRPLPLPTRSSSGPASPMTYRHRFAWWLPLPLTELLPCRRCHVPSHGVQTSSLRITTPVSRLRHAE